MKTFCYTAFIIILVLAASFELKGYSFKPLVTTYANQDNKCATQAWDATQDNRGWMYFATSDGLLTYNGVKWDYWVTPGVNIIRSVKAVDDRIYIGSYKEFGYFIRDEYGLPHYHSLNGLLKDYKYHDDEFWRIVPHDGKIYFQSFRSIFCYDGKKVETVMIPQNNPLNLTEVNRKLYSQLIHEGFNAFEEDSFREVVTRNEVNDNDIVMALPYDDRGMLLCTENSGIYLYSRSGDIQPFTTEIDKDLKSHCVNRAIICQDGTIVLGTLRNGIYGLTNKGTLKWHYNVENGLGNNTILGITEDNLGNIWVMMDHGISLIHAGLPYSFLKPDAKESYIGMTYAVGRDGDRLYLGTNQGLYGYSLSQKKMKAFEQVKSQIWCISEIDRHILVGSGMAYYEVDGDRILMKEGNGMTDIKIGKIHNQDIILESSYYSLRIRHRLPGGEWGEPQNIEDFGAPVRQIEIDSDGTIWCAHSAGGVMNLELSPDLNSLVRIREFYNAGPGHDRPTSFVMKIRGEVVVSDGDSLYCYDRHSGMFKAFNALHNDVNIPNDTYNATPIDDNMFWLSSRKSYTLVEYRDGHFSTLLTLPLDHQTFQSNGVNNKVYVDSEKNCFFTLNNGVGLLTLDKRPELNSVPKIEIASVEHIDPKGRSERLKLLPANKEKIKCNANITFNLCYPSYNLRQHKFRYTLKGKKNITLISDEPRVTFVGLKHGDYIFCAELLDSSGKEVASTTYKFSVPLPAYLSFWAIAGYLVAISLICVVVAKVYTRHQIKRQNEQHETERIAQDLKILEQENIISEQQKQLLKNELDVKSKELATMALKADFKNQVIENLRQTISEKHKKGQLNTKEIEEFLKTMNSDIDRTEFWSIFHNNFDLIHEKFFRNLRMRYPDLTPTDLKFCALMRLNMSTKDIAEFTHLTVRGVETARYRVRRKLGLNTKDSLVQFLIDFTS